jgi:hypothetical protein
MTGRSAAQPHRRGCATVTRLSTLDPQRHGWTDGCSARERFEQGFALYAQPGRFMSADLSLALADLELRDARLLDNV